MENKIKAIIGLGNPGPKYENTRHNIGFKVIDALAERYGWEWKVKDTMEIASGMLNNHEIELIKPQTFMNSSGKVIPFLKKMGIKTEEIVIIHDELELPFGKVVFKQGGSAKGHNGLKSIIEQAGDSFLRLRFGVDRPEHREEVPQYVLQSFNSVEKEKLEYLINQAVSMIESVFT